MKNAQSIGLETPLMSSVRGGSVEAVAILLNGGVNPFHTNGLGQSALDLAKNYWPRSAIPYCID